MIVSIDSSMTKKQSKMVKKQKMTKARKKELKATYEYLKVIKKLKAKEFESLVPYLSDEGTEQISRCISNVICREDIPERTRKRLKKALWNHKSDIRYLAKRSNPASGKRKRLPKIGGNITDIISTVLPILISLLAL